MICLMIIWGFLPSDYIDNIFLILIWWSRHLNNGHIYTTVVVKMHIFNEFTDLRLPVLQTYIYTFGSSHVISYIYVFGTQRVVAVELKSIKVGV